MTQIVYVKRNSLINHNTHIAHSEQHNGNSTFVNTLCGIRYTKLEVDLREYKGSCTCKKCNLVHEYTKVLEKMAEDNYKGE